MAYYKVGGSLFFLLWLFLMLYVCQGICGGYKAAKVAPTDKCVSPYKSGWPLAEDSVPRPRKDQTDLAGATWDSLCPRASLRQEAQAPLPQTGEMKEAKKPSHQEANLIV